MCANAYIIYYVIHKLVTLMRAMIHFKRHDHHIQDDMCKESFEEIKALVKEKVYPTLNSKNSTIGLFASKSLSQHLFNEDGGNLVELLKGKQLNKMMDNFCTLMVSQHL